MEKIRHLLFGIFFLTLSSVAAGYSRGPTTCNSPDVPEQGSYSPKKENDEFQVDESVTYKCEEGFILIGKERNNCHWSGSWANPPPVCDAKVDYLDYSGVHLSTKENVMYNLTDNSSSSCIPLGYSENITIYLTKKIAIVAVRLWFGVDSYIQIDIDKCIHPTWKNITHKPWESFKCNVSPNTKPIDQVVIKIQVKQNYKETSLCEMELYEKGENGCDSSLLRTREGTEGYFKFNRTRAMLTCKYGYSSKNSKLICEDGVWRGKDIHCEKKWSRKLTWYTAIGSGCAIIIVLFGIILYFIRKQRKGVVVCNPPNVIVMPEQDYASVYYDTMPTGVPLPPTSARPPGPQLNVEYALPADAKRKNRHQSLPTDIIGHYEKLTASPNYHD